MGVAGLCLVVYLIWNITACMEQMRLYYHQKNLKHRRRCEAAAQAQTQWKPDTLKSAVAQ